MPLTKWPLQKDMLTGGVFAATNHQLTFELQPYEQTVATELAGNFLQRVRPPLMWPPFTRVLISLFRILWHACLLTTEI